MEEKIIKVKVFTFKELSERVQKQIKRKTSFYFSEFVKDDTLFLSNGTFFNYNGLKFIGLSNFKIKI